LYVAQSETQTETDVYTYTFSKKKKTVTKIEKILDSKILVLKGLKRPKKNLGMIPYEE